MNKQTIIRKDGIIYERKSKSKGCNTHVNFRYNKDQVEKLKQIANKSGLGYQELIRNILNDYISNNL